MTSSRDLPQEPTHNAIRLLGRVSMRGPDGESVDLGGPKPRSVLVRLALRPGEIVSTDTLIDALWGDDPPPTARRSLQAHVAKLRAAAGGDHGPIRSSGVGYVLDVDRASVDVLRIEDGLALARAHLGSDPRWAAQVLLECRASWRGEPLVDLLREESLDATRARLARLGDELADLELELLTAAGDPVAAVPALEAEVERRPTHEPNWRRLITAYYSAGRQRDALDGFARAAATMREELGVEPSPELQRLELSILNQESAVAGSAEQCPYKGLVSYQVGDASRFHGRADVTQELVELVRRAPLGIVVGPSGVGKSSVLRAGLAATVLDGGVPGVESVAVLSPGPHPMRSLYETGPGAALLVVDQLEEIFTLCDDSTERTLFVEELIARSRAGTRVVLSVRADFYGHCLALPALAPVLGRHQVNVGTMSEAGLRDAIVGPARGVGLVVEPALVDELVAEVSSSPGALPLLSHALSETWRRREGELLTVAAYREAGSIGGAISATAERVHDGLDERGRGELARLFRRLVEPGEGIAHTRRRVRRGELDEAGFDRALVDRLVDARLFTAGADEVEIAHEALIEAWPRLQEWIDGERDDLVAHRRLARASAAWAESGRDDSELYRGTKLDGARSWLAGDGPVLTDAETEFLRASDLAATAEERRRRRTGRVLRGLTVGSLAGLVVAIVATTVAVGRTRDAEARRDAAEVNELVQTVAADSGLTQTDTLRLASALVDRAATFEARGLLLDAALAAPAVRSVDPAGVVSINADVPTYASGLAVLVADTAVLPAVLDTRSGGAVERLASTPAAVFGRPDGVLVVHPDTLEVVNVATGRPVGPAPEVDREPADVVLAADGEVLVVASDADPSGPARVEVFATGSGEAMGAPLVLSGSANVDQVEFSAPSRVLAVVDGVAAQVWDIDAPDAPSVATVAPGSASTISTSAFNVWGDAFVIGREDGSVELWRESDRWRRTVMPPVHRDEVTWAEFDTLDERLITSSRDGTVAVFDAQTGALEQGPVRFATRGDLVSWFDIETGDAVTLAPSSSIWRWDPRSGSVLTERSPLPGRPTEAVVDAWYAVGESGARQRSGGEWRDLPGTAGAVDVAGGWSGHHVIVFDDRLDWRDPDGGSVAQIRVSSPPAAVAVSGASLAYQEEDDGRIVVVDRSGTVAEWIGIDDDRGALAKLLMSPDGTNLVYQTVGGEVVWYSLTSFDAAVLAGEATDVAFIGPNTLLVAAASGVAEIELGAGDPQRRELRLGSGAVAATSGDTGHGRVVITADADGALRLWDPVTGRQLGSAYRPSSGVVAELAVVSAALVVVGADDTTITLPLDSDVWRARACAVADATDPGGAIPVDARYEGLIPCA